MFFYDMVNSVKDGTTHQNCNDCELDRLCPSQLNQSQFNFKEKPWQVHKLSRLATTQDMSFCDNIFLESN